MSIRKAGLWRYFEVDDILKIRESARFKEEVLPLFNGPVDLITADRCDNLAIIGYMKDHPDHKGMYTLACNEERSYGGMFVKSSMVF